MTASYMHAKFGCGAKVNVFRPGQWRTWGGAVVLLPPPLENTVVVQRLTYFGQVSGVHRGGGSSSPLTPMENTKLKGNKF